MLQNKYPHLFQPITLAGTLFRNRIFAAPTGYRLENPHSSLTPEAEYYYSRKAMGGAAAVATCEMIVDGKHGKGHQFHLNLEDPSCEIPMGKVAHEISRYGAVATAELQHAGMYANRDLAMYGGTSRGDAFAPVAMDVDGRYLPEMPEEKILDIIDKFAKGAALAKARGYGMIMIHAGHGWLLQQFLSPKINTRKDKWGGSSIENRARFTVSICDAVRKAVGPKMPIEVRISGTEAYDGGYGIEEGIAFAKQLEGHIDLLHVSVGSHEKEEVFTVTHPSMFLGEGCNVKYAAEIKKNISTPVATVGAIGDPELMEEIIASGQADIVSLARSLIADPDLPNKIRAGKEEDILPCLRCLYCFSCQMNWQIKYCAVNPEAGRERETAFTVQKAKNPKKVLVVGGGIGGMQAALSCADFGHEVVLCEKDSEFGGALLCEKDVPFKKNLDSYINSQISKINKSSVDARLNTKVTSEYVDEIKPDVVIAAMGAKALKPRIPGIDKALVMSAEEAYKDASKVADKSVILGAGLVGLELAIYLSLLGKEVIVVEMLDKMNDGGNILHGKGIKVEIDKHSIPVHFKTKVEEITDDGIICSTEDGTKSFEANNVIYAVGQVARLEEAIAMQFSAPEFFMIGDCISPANIPNATEKAFAIARNIGRY